MTVLVARFHANRIGPKADVEFYHRHLAPPRQGRGICWLSGAILSGCFLKLFHVHAVRPFLVSESALCEHIVNFRISFSAKGQPSLFFGLELIQQILGGFRMPRNQD